MLFPNDSKAFSRVELLAVCTVLSLIALVVAPAAVSTKSHSERIICFNNLRLVGRAVQMWAADHNQQTPCRTPMAEGGLLPSGGTRPGNAWFEFAFLSNELVTPVILACPADAAVKKADDFGGADEGGFIGVNYRAAALSYVFGLEAIGESPRSWLSSDRNLGGVTQGGSCPTRVINLSTIQTGPSFASISWTNGVVHGIYGHALLMDGSVEFTSTPQLKALFLSPQASVNGTTHFLRAR